MADTDRGTIDALLEERRTFPPPEGFRKNALVSDTGIYDRAADELEGFWADQASTLQWTKTWDTVLQWDPPWVKWFEGGRLNVAVNCLDRHLEENADRALYEAKQAGRNTTRSLTA